MSLIHRTAGLAVLTVAIAGSTPAMAASGPGDKDAQAVLAAIKDVCLPILKGAKIEGLAKATGLRNSRDGWMLPIDGKRRVAIDPPGGANPNLCTGTVVHDPNAGASILAALVGWAAAQTPPLPPVKVEEKATGALYQLTTSSWEGKLDGADAALVYSEDKTLEGRPVAGKLDQSTFALALTPAAAS